MIHRWAIRWVAAVLAVAAAVAPAPAAGESMLRMYYAIIKSFHPDSNEDYSTVHPSVGLGGPLIGEWLRWRAGMTYNSHSRWGPFGGLVATFEVTEGWRVGLSAGLAGNYSEGRWVRRGALPIVQWKGRDSALIWEAGFVHREDTTFVGLGVHVPFSLLEAK